VTAPSEVIERLRKICGMLGPEHEGERAAAVTRANELLAKHKLTWAEIIAGESAAPQPQQRQQPRSPISPGWNALSPAHEDSPSRGRRADAQRQRS
jgi:hypothetical protein